MKKIYPLLALVFLGACQSTNTPKNRLFATDSLPTQIVHINTAADTVLSTANGALITIPKGSLQSADGSSTASLEIKEAYTMEQIIRAGLFTQSDGKPLSSGGMIYINAAAGAEVKILKKIGVKIPTSSYSNKMRLYRGETTKDGSINWTDPTPLAIDSSNPLIAGERLFKGNCASCHAIIGRRGTGPDLAYVATKTADRKKLYAFTRNNQQVMATDPDPYYRCLYYSNGKAAMNLFTSLSDQDLDALYAYIENESRVQHLPLPDNQFRKAVDSCVTYRHLLDSLQQRKDKLTKGGLKAVINSIQSSGPSRDLPTGPPVKVQPVSIKTLYYQFELTGFGWSNIDALLSDMNAVESTLKVRVTGNFAKSVEVYLVIPAARVYQPGGFLENQAQVFGFWKMDGTIFLPQRLDAYVLAMGEVDGKIVFASTAFLTARNIELTLSPAALGKAAIDEALKKISMADLRIQVQETETGKEIKQVDKAIGALNEIRPKNCDCQCIDLPTRPDTAQEFFIRPVTQK